MGHFVQFCLGILSEVNSAREVLTKESIRIFVCSSLPRTLRITEVHRDIRADSEELVMRELWTAIPGERLAKLDGEFSHLSSQRLYHALGVFP